MCVGVVSSVVGGLMIACIGRLFFYLTLGWTFITINTIITIILTETPESGKNYIKNSKTQEYVTLQERHDSNQ